MSAVLIPRGIASLGAVLNPSDAPGERLAGDLNRRSALVLGIAGPDPGLDEADLAVPSPLVQAPQQAERLAASLTAYRYRDVLAGSREPDGVAAATDVQVWVDAALAEPGLVVVHLLTHGLQGPGRGVLYVLGPDGAEVPTSVGEWLNRAEKRSGDFGPVLFILDVCHAGAAVGYQLQHLVDIGHPRAWVLAAAGSADPAYDGRLTRALSQVLDSFRSGELRVDPSVRYIPLRRVFGEVDRLVQEHSRGSYPQQIHSSYVPLHVDIDRLEFFPNPGWDPALQGSDVRGQVVAELSALLDEAFDPRHFMRRAGAAEAVFGPVGRGFFHGRTEQLQQLRGWVIGTGPTLRVVTGKPGVGKSALLGVMICAAHPALREPTRDLWDRLAANMPPPLPEGCLAVVHARRRTVEEIIASIARQWQLPAPDKLDGDEHGAWTSQQLVAALSRPGAGPGGPALRRLLVIDAVDETDRPDELVARVLSPLAVACSEDGGPLCRILVSGRDEPHLRPLIEAAVVVGGLTDLGAIPRRQLRPALNAYVKELLGHGTPYERLPYAPAADVLAEAIAGTLTAGPGTDADPAPQWWGEFLVAGLYVRYVLDLPPVQELAEARELGEAVPRDLRRVLALDLGRSAPGLDGKVLRAVAQALAFAEGSGMPERVTGHVATTFLPATDYPADLGSDQIRTALDRLRFYLRQDVDLDGGTLYRLFHQGLADQLRADISQDDPAVTSPGPDARVWQRLYAMIPAGPDGMRRWQHAEPYMLRHAAQHAAASGQLNDLLQDAGFLTYADPVTLAPLLAAMPAGTASGAADAYRASYAAHSWQPPTARAQILAVDAARYGNFVLARRLSSTAFWQPIWATSKIRSPRLRLTLTGHPGQVLAVALGRAEGRDVIISGSSDQTIRIWDASTGQPVGSPMTGHTTAVCTVAIGRAGERDMVVSGSHDQTVRVWDAITGQPVGLPLTGHTDGVDAVALGRAGGRDVIISGSYDRTVRVWDAITGQPVGLPLTGHTGGVNAVALGRAGGRDVIISGSYDRTVRVWDAITGQPVGPPLTGHTGGVRAVAVGAVGDRDMIASGSDDQTVRLWDAVTEELVQQLNTGHAGGVLAVAVGRAEGQDVIISSGPDGSVRIWDAITGQPVCPPLTGHTSAVCAVAVGQVRNRDVIVSSGVDGIVGVWDAITAQPAEPLLTGHTDVVGPAANQPQDRRVITCGGPDEKVGRWDVMTAHTGRVDTLTMGRVGDREVVVSGSYDQTVRVWDAITGQPVGAPLTGHTDWVFAVAVGRVGDREVVVSGSNDETVRVWDAKTGQPVGPPLTGHTGTVRAVAVGRVGGRDVVVSGSKDETVRVWDAKTGRPVGPPLTGHTGPVYAVAVGRAGGLQVIASGGQDGTIRVWDAKTGRPVGAPLTGHTDWGVFAVAVGRVGDGEVVVSGGHDGTVRVWDAKTGRPVGPPLTGHTSPVCAVAVGLAGGLRVITSGGYDQTVRVWDAETGQPVAQQRFPDMIPCLALARDTLATAQGNDVVVLRINSAILPLTGFSFSQDSNL